MSDKEEERMSYYMEIGAVELAGMDDSGEFIFKITEKAKDVAPELWQAHEDHVNRSLIELYDKGLINIVYDDNLDAFIEMSPEGRRAAKEFGLIDSDFNEDDIPNN